MGRCPKYLRPDDFDRLADSIGLSLTDDGVSALGEICEFLAQNILREAAADTRSTTLDFDAITRAAQKSGVGLQIATDAKTVQSATFGIREVLAKV